MDSDQPVVNKEVSLYEQVLQTAKYLGMDTSDRTFFWIAQEALKVRQVKSLYRKFRVLTWKQSVKGRPAEGGLSSGSLRRL